MRCKQPVYNYTSSLSFNQLLLSLGQQPRYIYHMLKFNQCTLPVEAFNTLRLQSFSQWHEKGAYRQFEAPGDAETLKWVKEFNQIRNSGVKDAASESHEAYYADLLKKYNIVGKLKW